jgi:hypothetical protein
LGTDGFLDLGRNRYLKLRPERLHENLEPAEPGTPRLFHGVYFWVGDEEDGQMLDFEQYQRYLIFGDVPCDR